MSDSFLERLVDRYADLAAQLYDYRLYFAVFAPIPFLSMFFLNGLLPVAFLVVFSGWAMASFAWSWGIFLLCSWFHPEHGALNEESFWRDLFPMFPTSPKAMAVGLTLWFVMWPIMAILWSF